MLLLSNIMSIARGKHKIGADSYVVIIQPRSGKRMRMSSYEADAKREKGDRRDLRNIWCLCVWVKVVMY